MEEMKKLNGFFAQPNTVCIFKQGEFGISLYLI